MRSEYKTVYLGNISQVKGVQAGCNVYAHVYLSGNNARLWRARTETTPCLRHQKMMRTLRKLQTQTHCWPVEKDSIICQYEFTEPRSLMIGVHVWGFFVCFFSGKK